jgi:hypothetical protein
MVTKLREVEELGPQYPWSTVLPRRPSHPTVRATLNTNTTTKHKAIEPRTVAIIARFSSVKLYRP